MSDRAPRFLLAASLAINLFVFGAVVGAGFMWLAQGQPDAPGAGQQRGLRFAAEELSRDQRRAFRGALADARRQSASDIDGARAGREEVARLLATEPFDRAAVEAALAATRQSDMALRARLEEAIAGFAAGLTPDERARLADGLRARTGMLRGTDQQ
ncbi:periplasmic heavy metal sensor [Mesorhizobium sp. CAU 1741]|uniref:periplasmic heavy metal sensor n=1 Tax=Mesorhizobium sp. CAU 1741 TaxID=3140366 RepID=UPI00325C0BFC